MTLFRVTSGRLWTALAISAAAGGVARIIELVYRHTDLARAVSTGYQPLYIAANVLALYYCLKIRSDHESTSTMRVSWLLIAASCATTIVRHAFEWTAFLVGWWSTRMETLVSLRQIPTALAMVFLTAGLAAMWSSYTAVGLGMRFRWRDGALAAVIVALMAVVWTARGHMYDANSDYPLMRHLQSSGPLLIAAPALLCLVLQRISREMQGGQFADSLRYLAWSLLLRMLNMVITFFMPLWSMPVLAVAAAAAFWASGWLFTLAIFHRWRLTVSLHELADLYEKNPAEGLARLSSAACGAPQFGATGPKQ
jgi:hypothetical protein